VEVAQEAEPRPIKATRGPDRGARRKRQSRNVLARTFNRFRTDSRPVKCDPSCSLRRPIRNRRTPFSVRCTRLTTSTSNPGTVA